MMNITQSIDITQIHNFFNSMKCVWMWVGGAYVDKISAIHYSKCEQMFVISLNCLCHCTLLSNGLVFNPLVGVVLAHRL